MEFAPGGAHDAVVGFPICSSGCKRTGVLLVDAGESERVLAGFELVADLTFDQQALIAVIGRCQRGIHAWREDMVIRDAYPETEIVVGAEPREQQA
ncbi:hypothetical protein D3C73_924050 [compost metagenome]